MTLLIVILVTRTWWQRVNINYDLFLRVSMSRIWRLVEAGLFAKDSCSFDMNFRLQAMYELVKISSLLVGLEALEEL